MYVLKYEKSRYSANMHKKNLVREENQGITNNNPRLIHFARFRLIYLFPILVTFNLICHIKYLFKIKNTILYVVNFV